MLQLFVMGDPLSNTNFKLPGQVSLYHGKVRDVYTLQNNIMVSVATDRISAFDVILPRAIPFKGQVLNQIAKHFLTATKDIVPNWLINSPDPNASIGHLCEPFKIEMVIRGCLTGHAWREYKAGKRELCGEAMSEGLQEYDEFSEALITPSTKADTGHDEDISYADIIKTRLATQAEFDELCRITRALFARGQSMAADQGLFLADTKYEFGKKDGKIYLIDEVHTPDSSRYFDLPGYQAFIKDRNQPEPAHLSKEFVRQWLLENNFSGQEGQAVPEMSDDFVKSVSAKYVGLFERITGRSFAPADTSNITQRVESNIIQALEEL